MALLEETLELGDFASVEGLDLLQRIMELNDR